MRNFAICGTMRAHAGAALHYQHHAGQRHEQLADPESNLPGARNAVQWLDAQLPKNLKHTTFLGEQATVANLLSNLGDADLVMIGAHGSFKLAHCQVLDPFVRITSTDTY
jgi:hypothetical protein